MWRRVATSNEIGMRDLAALMCLQIELALYVSVSEYVSMRVYACILFLLLYVIYFFKL